MAWLLLVVAGVLEIGFALSLKESDGFTRLWPTLLFLGFGAASLGLLNLAVRDLPIGTAYAVWTGIGTVGTAILGILLFGDSAGALRLACIALIVAGILGLKLVS